MSLLKINRKTAEFWQPEQKLQHYKWLDSLTSSSAIAERPRCRWVSFGQKWKIFSRQYRSIFNLYVYYFVLGGGVSEHFEAALYVVSLMSVHCSWALLVVCRSSSGCSVSANDSCKRCRQSSERSVTTSSLRRLTARWRCGGHRSRTTTLRRRRWSDQHTVPRMARVMWTSLMPLWRVMI